MSDEIVAGVENLNVKAEKAWTNHVLLWSRTITLIFS